MNDQKHRGQTPPDLPPEYAEAYRRGYERAYRESAGAETEPARAGQPDVEPTLVDMPRVPDPRSPEEDTYGGEGGMLDEMFGASPEPEPEPEREPEPEPTGVHRGESDERVRPTWFVPAVLAALVAILLLSAYGIGRVLSSSVDGADVSEPKPDSIEVGGTEEDPKDSAEQSPAEDKGGAAPGAKAYQGRVTSVSIGSASASCQAPSSVDAAGHPVRYPPSNMYDGDMSTAWRCNGIGVGQTVTLTLPAKTKLGQLGLVPGYAKTDPRNGADRYAENNRITRVRWSFPDGTTYVQRFDGSPANRSLQTRRIPVTAAGEVVIEILESVRGPRNTVAISEVKVGQVA